MATTQNRDFGWKAGDFALEGIDGKTYSLANVARRIIACLKPSAAACASLPPVTMKVERSIGGDQNVKKSFTHAILPNKSECRLDLRWSGG
jgi:hypothetical protein